MQIMYAMKETMENQAKAIEITGRIAKGGRVPTYDQRYDQRDGSSVEINQRTVPLIDKIRRIKSRIILDIL